jgi:hypothetical protein
MMVDEEEQDSDDTANQMDLPDNQEYHPWRGNLQTHTQSPPSSSAESTTISQDQEHILDAELHLINPSIDVDNMATYIDPSSDQSDMVLVSKDATFNVSKQNDAICNHFPGPHLGLKLHVCSGSTLSTHLDHIHGLLRLGGALECGSR